MQINFKVPEKDVPKDAEKHDAFFTQHALEKAFAMSKIPSPDALPEGASVRHGYVDDDFQRGLMTCALFLPDDA